MFNVYLSSTSYHFWNLTGYFWKSKLKKLISKYSKNKINFIDPLTFRSNDPIVCKIDLRDINNSSFVAIYLDKITIGTMLELGYCLYHRHPDTWCIYSKTRSVLKHPWILYLCKKNIFTDINKVSRLIIKKSNEFYNYKNHG